MAEYLIQDTSLTSIADAIREKAGLEDNLAFPAGFVEAIEGLGGVEYATVDVVLAEDSTELLVDVPDSFWYTDENGLARGPDFAVCYSKMDSSMNTSSSSGHLAVFVRVYPYISSQAKKDTWAWMYSKGTGSQRAPFVNIGNGVGSDTISKLFSFNTNYKAGIVYRCVFFKGVVLT